MSEGLDRLHIIHRLYLLAVGDSNFNNQISGKITNAIKNTVSLPVSYTLYAIPDMTGIERLHEVDRIHIVKGSINSFVEGQFK